MDADSAAKKRILLVEDDESIQRLYAKLLTQAGYSVEVASTGNEGYAKMAEGGYDLVLLDVMLPDFDGIAVLAKLRDNGMPKRPNRSVMLLTNLNKDNYIAKALEYNISGYMVKSDFDASAFLKEIAGRLSS
jgi:DNA-binding response OmpR family regulator